MNSPATYDVLVLAASRGSDDPMARTFDVKHKCLVPVGGVPMISRVVGTLKASPNVRKVAICMDDPDAARPTLEAHGDLVFTPPAESAPASVLRSLEDAELDWPVLVTTADHALLTPEMLSHFLERSAASGADLTVGLATRETIEAGLPETRRTYLRFADVQVSGCNLFALGNRNALEAVRFWQRVDENRKRPWKMIGAFGPGPLLLWLTGRLTLERAFGIASGKLNVVARAVLMPFAEAAVDVDKPEDKELADELLGRRTAAGS